MLKVMLSFVPTSAYQHGKVLLSLIEKKNKKNKKSKIRHINQNIYEHGNTKNIHK